MACKCKWCGECAATRKSVLAAEPQECRSARGINHKDYPKGKKARIDLLKQAEKDFYVVMERREDAKVRAASCSWAPSHQRNGARCWHWDKHDDRWFRDAAKRYYEAMVLCVDAGDVPPPSWYGMSR